VNCLKRDVNFFFFVSNDSDIASLTEVSLVAAKKEKGVVINIGTGIGSVLFYDGMLIPNLAAGKMVHNDGEVIELHSAVCIREKRKFIIGRMDKKIWYLVGIFKNCVHTKPHYLRGGIHKKYEDFKKHLTIDVKVAKFRSNAGILGAEMYAGKKYK